MPIIKAPNKIVIDDFSIFLAGSIEMGKAVDWQTSFGTFLIKKYPNITVLNPRRDDWDSSWKQEKENTEFRTQVEWELESQEKSDIVAMYFDPTTKSPISLLELGLFAEKMIVYCPRGFWRKGNVDIVCERYDIPIFDSKSRWIAAIIKKIDAGIETL